MKKIYSLILALICVSVLCAQTEQNPLTISQAIAQQNSGGSGVWVKGYIVGEMHNYSNNKYFYSVAPLFQGTATFLLADAPYEHDFSKCLVVQYPASALVDELNLEEHPEYWQKELTLCGTLQSYMSAPGLKSISDYRIATSSQLEDETAYWNFFEDAEDGSYTAHSSSSMFAGGIYRGDASTWDIVGGTYGNSSNDNKWDGASFRLRYTEGASGNKGTLTMTTDKGNGLGWIRFWAGNYKDDSALSAAISVYYSVDGGRQWVSVADQVAVKRGSSNTNNGMSEYAFLVNVAGSVRIKIEKADNTSAGINIDNIRLSDYRMPVSVEDALMYQPWYYTYQGGICFMSVNAPYTAYIYHVSGALLHSVEVNGADRMIPMSTGMYVVASKLGSGKLIIK